MTAKKCPLVLIVLDGWGYSEATEHNAIHTAKSPVWDRLWAENPKTLISGSGMDVGLPEGQMGNSEVGHMTLGAGRILYQNYTRINKAIADGDFYDNSAYTSAVDKAMANGGTVHIFGLLSPGGVHSHEDHIAAAIRLAARRGCNNICLHAFLDGRDTPPRSAAASIALMEKTFAEVGCGRIASLSGRYYAMDRDKRWERVQPVYDMLTQGVADYRAANAASALQSSYDRNENDEFVKPTLIVRDGEAPGIVRDGDSILFMNFRPDRAREITQAFVDDSFNGFERSVRPQLADFVMTTEYSADLGKGGHTHCAYPPETLVNSFGEYVASLGKTQLRIAETEKYAHVTFFFSGGREELYHGEQRILVDSPKVATYDLQPEMSAPEVTDKLVAAIESGAYDCIICNYANGDMVGHTGIFDAAVKAVEALDQCLGRVLQAVTNVGGDCLITADHGNVEQMLDEDNQQPLTSHTTLPVPLVYAGGRKVAFNGRGTLADIAPTMLYLMGLPQPAEMSGHNLIKLP
ncbi:MAG: 2,3-bisphosphoglycerate-independent phosphoglycerate mutase [Porticoccaceae bacterium]|nr:2,3-bisphosphoglycerate-independent phosphoglycerate mutase [Porticoccaceae bacterium]